MARRSALQAVHLYDDPSTDTCGLRLPHGQDFPSRSRGSAHPISAGVPQGSCSSPVLYSRYTDDIPARHTSTLALYADDAAYTTTSLTCEHAANKMQRALDDLPDWLSKWRLSVNVGKTQAMIIITRARHFPPKPRLLDADIEWTRTAKYLGVTLDRRVIMRRHVRNTIARVIAPPRALRAPPATDQAGGVQVVHPPPAHMLQPGSPSRAQKTGRASVRSSRKRKIVAAPRYVRNNTISRDLRVESIRQLHRSAGEDVRASRRVPLAPYPGPGALARATPDAKRFPRDLVADDAALTPTGLDPE